MKIIKNSVKGIALLATLIDISACSSVTHSSYAQKAGLFPDRDALYMQGKNLPPLQFPAGSPSISNDPYFVIPSVSPTVANNTVSLIPPGSLAAKNAGQGTNK
ncbi:MAG: hypothetical protein K2Q14_07280 [Gammaproteobacteria bacterium]|nr:hypothetical protein [Gammaproteobacteria bacterium]